MRIAKTVEKNETSAGHRAPWQAPAVSRMRAGQAEVGFTNTVDDGPGTKS
jgi:hypothetical protein